MSNTQPTQSDAQQLVAALAARIVPRILAGEITPEDVTPEYMRAEAVAYMAWLGDVTHDWCRALGSRGDEFGDALLSSFYDSLRGAA